MEDDERQGKIRLEQDPEPEKGEPGNEISRREFLYIAGVFGMATGLDPLQTTVGRPGNDKTRLPKPNILKPGHIIKNEANKNEKAVPKPLQLKNLVISALRPDDLLCLEFECLNLIMKPGSSPKLVREKPAEAAYLIVHFPPQHITEQAIFETTPDFKPVSSSNSDPAAAEPVPAPPVKSIIAGGTRLAFLIPKDIDEIPLTLESLMSWEMYEPSLVPVAVAPKIASRTSSVSAVGLASANAARSPQTVSAASSYKSASSRPVYSPAILPGGAPSRNIYEFRASKISAQTVTALLKLAEPTEKQTALEIPYRLVLSPNPFNVWAHSIQAVTRNGRTELWHTRLAAANPDGTISDSGSPYMAVRAVWSPDCLVDSPNSGPGHSNSPFRMSLDRQDRHEIVHLTSNFHLKHGSKDWTPKPVDVNRLMLTTLGGWLDSSGEWNPTAISVQEWRHRAVMGRDNYVKVVYKGFLMPFGNNASLIKITERKFKKGQDGKQIAYLFQRMYIIVRQPEKSFPAAYQLNDAREIPFRRVRITSLMTPPLDDPSHSELINGALQSAFWPRVQGGDFLFHCVAEDWAGSESEFAVPMAFVDTNYAFDSSKMKAAVGSYDGATNLERRTTDLHGQTIAFAEPDKKGDTDLETGSLTFIAFSPDVKGSTDGWIDADQPLFFPVMTEAAVSIPALKNMVQFGSTAINYSSNYISNGLGGSANKGQVFAAIASAPVLDFGAGGKGDKAGGVATPSFSIVGLSRTLGPVGGMLAEGESDAKKAAEAALADVAGGTFDPTKFFDDKAKLLGGLKLIDIIRKVTDFTSGSSADQALTIKNKVVQDQSGVPTEVQTLLTWKPAVDDFTIFIAERDGTKAAMSVNVQNITYLDGRDPYYEMKGELTDFTLDLVQPIVSLIKIKFDRFAFAAKKGQKTDFDPKINKIEFDGPLNFVKELLDKIELPGGAGGSLGKPIIDISTSGATLGYTFNIPTVAFGVFTLQDMSFGASVSLPFNGDPLSFRFAFNERSRPFLLTVSLFGGGGFFAIELEPGGIKLIEASLEFGGSFALSLGVASGSVTLMAGIYFKYENSNVTITGYVRCCGVLDVLGLISITAEFYLGLTYEQAANCVWGQATLTVKVKVLFFSTSVSLTVERTFAHSPAPYFADMMDESHWLDYCEAFA